MFITKDQCGRTKIYRRKFARRNTSFISSKRILQKEEKINSALQMMIFYVGNWTAFHLEYPNAFRIFINE